MKTRPSSVSLAKYGLGLSLLLLCAMVPAQPLLLPGKPDPGRVSEKGLTVEFGGIGGLRQPVFARAFMAGVAYLETRAIHIPERTLRSDEETGQAVADNLYRRLREQKLADARARAGANEVVVCAYVNLAEARHAEKAADPAPVLEALFVKQVESTCLLTVNSNPPGAMVSINHDPMRRVERKKYLEIGQKHVVEAVWQGQQNRTEYPAPTDATPIDLLFDFTKP